MIHSLKPIRLGFIGAGFIGQIAHIDNYAQIKNCRIVALAAGRCELRQRVAQRYNIARTYSTHRELLQDPDVEAVVAVTARSGTGPVALDCLKAGKPLLTEKPMASTLEQAQKLVKAAKAKKITYVVGYMRRYDTGIQTAKKMLDKLIKTKELGPLLYTRYHCFAGDAYCKCSGHIVTNEKKTEHWETWPIAPRWVPDSQKMEYHQYLNQYCHTINLLRYFFGKSPLISHVQLNKPGFQAVIFDFGGHSATLETGRYLCQEWDEAIEIYFAQGRLRIKIPPPLLRNVPAKVELYKGGKVEQTCEFHAEPTWSFRCQAEAFIRDVSEGRESLSSGTDALEDIRLVEAIWQMRYRKNDSVH